VLHNWIRLNFCKWATLLVLGFCLVVVGQSTARADDSTSAGPVDRYPPNPATFFRGNEPGNAGHYLHVVKVGFLIGLFFLWTWSGRWVDQDSGALKVRRNFWNSLIFGCGLAGFLLAVTMPAYFFGASLLLLLYGVPLGFYINERNAKVPESGKVLTPRHLQKVANQLLAKVGIHLGPVDSRVSAVGPPIRFVGKSTAAKGDDHARARQVENSKGFVAAKQMIYDAILRRSTDVHLEPKEDETGVRMRIDGVMYPTEPLDRPMGDAIVNIFKVLSAMDITERRKPQDGSFRAIMEDREIDFRVATQGTRHGEKMSLRILDQSNSVASLAKLGFRKQLQEQVLEIINQPHGMFLVCGPTGAGKSTTLYASLCEIDSYQRNIITVEDPVEYKIDNVTQIEINTKAGQTFAGSLRSILRQDPDVVMIGEIRDAETAKIACQASTTGHMVFSTVHANDTITALYRLIDLDVETFMLASSISGILGQRLARKLCPDCKEAYRPNPEFLKKANLPAGKVDKFYRPPKNPEGQCMTCGGLGYYGRIGVFELLVITDRMRDMVREKASLSALKAEARKNGMLYMKEEGLRLVVRGVTSIDELLRVVK
jgi:general secretion pathway protein E